MVNTPQVPDNPQSPLFHNVPKDIIVPGPDSQLKLSGNEYVDGSETFDSAMVDSHPVKIVNTPEHTDKSKLGKALDVAKRALQETVIHLEVNPFTNAPMRYAVAGATLKVTKDPYLAGAAFGASTLVLEGGAGLATADVLSSENKESKTLNLIQKGLNHAKVQRFVVTKDGDLLPVAEGLLAVYAGTAIVMTAKEGEEEAEKRTHLDRKKYGLKTAVILGAVCTAQGMLVAAGIDNYQDPKVVVPIVATAVGGNLGLRKLKNRVNREKEAKESLPKYDLSHEDLKTLEDELVKEVDKQTKSRFRKKQPGLYAVWISPDNKFANVIRNYEAGYFPEVKELTNEVEEDTTFLAMVDTRKDARRVVHAATISGSNEKTGFKQSGDETGFTTIDQLIEKGNFTAQDFRDYYKEHGIDLENSISVDTNFRVGEPTDIDGLKSGDLAYLSLFQLTQRRSKNGSSVAVFASINQASIDSFNRVGIKCLPLMGRTDMTTPESLEGKDFHPVIIPVDENIRQIFEGMGLKMPELKLA